MWSWECFKKLNYKFLVLCTLFNIIMNSLSQEKRKMPDIDELHPVPHSVVTASSEWHAKNTPVKKVNKRSKSKIQDDLDRLRKSRQFRDLGDALDYFSD